MSEKKYKVSMSSVEPNPYKGPYPFEGGDLLFGRDRETKTILSLVVTSPVVLVYAPSGAGKTSLVNAKLCPDLVTVKGFEVLPTARVVSNTREEREGIENIYVFNSLLYLDPGPDPLADQEIWDQRLELTKRESFIDFLRRKYPDEGGDCRPRVLIFDQFEEILTAYPERREDREGFFLQLREALASDPELNVVFVMREDHIAGLDRYAPLLPSRLRTRFRMERLGCEAAVSAIRCPAQKRGRAFASGVAEGLVDNLRQERGSGEGPNIPGEFVEPVQLQVVCRQLWQSLGSCKGEITQEHVSDFGDVDEALEIFYTKAVRNVAHETSVNETQIRCWFGETLITESRMRSQVDRGSDKSGGLHNDAVDQLVDAHLVRSEQARGGIWLELVHDRFIDPILASNEKWLSAAEQTALAKDAREWQQRARDVSFLYEGQKLVDAIGWARGHSEAVEDLDREFLDASKAEAQRAVQRIQTAKRLRLLTIGLTLALLTALALGMVALAQAQKAERQAQLSRTHTMTIAALGSLEKNPPRSLQLALGAAQLSYALENKVTPETLDVLSRALRASRSKLIRSIPTGEIDLLTLDLQGHRLGALDSEGRVGVWDVETGSKLLSLGASETAITNSTLSRDGSRLASVDSEGTLKLWGVDAQRVLHAFPTGVKVFELLFSPDGTRVAATGLDGTLTVWEAESGREILSLTDPAGAITAAAFGPAGNRLASISDAGMLTVRDLGSGEVLLEFASEDDYGVSFSPHGMSLASIGSDGLEIWDLKTSARVGRSLGGDSNIYAGAFGPEGRHAVVASTDGIARIWDLETNLSALALHGDPDFNHRPALSGNGRRLAIPRQGGTTEVWELLFDEVARAISGHRARVNAVAIDSDGKLLASGSDDKTARVWEIDTGRILRTLRGHAAPVNSVAFSPDNRLLATASDDRTARIWSVEAGDLERTLSGHSNTVTAVAWSPDGASIATASTDGTVRLWDSLSEEDPLTLFAAAEGIEAVAYGPKGKFLATGGADGAARLWDARTGKEIGIFSDHSDIVTAVAFSSDGGSLATASDNRIIKLWDVASKQLLHQLDGHTGLLTDIAFGPAGKRLATCGLDKTVVLWDVDSGSRILTIPSSSPLYGVAYSPDGKRLATASRDGLIRLEKYLSVEALIAVARERTGREPAAQ